jgi:hypothetical protein
MQTIYGDYRFIHSLICSFNNMNINHENNYLRHSYCFQFIYIYIYLSIIIGKYVMLIDNRRNYTIISTDSTTTRANSKLKTTNRQQRNITIIITVIYGDYRFIHSLICSFNNMNINHENNYLRHSYCFQFIYIYIYLSINYLTYYM